MRSARGRVIAVTGATGGIGRAVVRAFAARGDDIALIARGREGLASAAEEVVAAGSRALVVPVDVADAQAVEEAADRIESELGPIDVWVNAAFTSVFARFDDIEPDEYRRVTDATYHGFVNGTRAALRRMRRRDRGTIVQVGSALGYRGIPLQSAYCGAKHAINGFNEALRTELLSEGSGVRLTIVQMPGVNTPQFSWVLSKLPRKPRPVAPVYQPEVAARAVVYAADHPRKAEYWVGGSTVATIVGEKLVPRLLDRYLARTGVSSQQTSEPVSPDRPANLWAPADGEGRRDYGAHGSFDGEAHAHSPQLWLSTHRRMLAGAAAGTALVGAGALARRR